mgnify:CR=1 FL=1
MTNDELKSFYLDLIKGLENGLVPNPDYSEHYSKARENNTLESSLDELDDLNKKMNQGIDVSGFTKEAFNSLSDIREIIDNDPLFLRNSGNEEFTKYLNEVREQFNIAGEALTNEQVLKNCEEVLSDNEALLQDANKKRTAIKSDSSLSMLDKSIMYAEANALYEKRLQARDLAIKVRDEQKVKFEASLNDMKKNLNINEFINGILKSVNKLDVSYRNLAISSGALEKLGDAIRDLRDKVVVFRNDALFDEAKYNEILKNCGLMKAEESKEELDKKISEIRDAIAKLDDNVELISEEVKNDTQEKDEEPGFSVDDLIPEEISLDNVNEKKEEVSEEKVEEKPVVEAEKESKSIETVAELVTELKKLNPNAKISNIDGTYTLEEDINTITLPKNFKYDNNLGINNKVDDFTPYISLDVKAPVIEEKQEETRVAEPVAPEKKENPKKIDTAPQVPSGKLKVEKIRKAVVAPYVKSILCFGSIEGICWILAGSNPLALTSVIAGSVTLGVLAQGIYNKLVSAGTVKGMYNEMERKDPNFEGEVWAYPVLNKFMNMFKDIRHNKKNTKEEVKGASEEEKQKEPEVKNEEVVEELTPAVEEPNKEDDIGFQQLFNNTLESNLKEIDEENTLGGRR